MFESVTYENIMTRMLDKVRAEYPKVDTREGSLIYTAIAPCAIELAVMYTELDRVLTESFAETASLEYLEKRANERGLTQNLATCAVMQGKFDVKVPVGTRFSLGDYNYVVIDSTESELQCEVPGSGANTVFGTLTPIDPINEITSAEIIGCLIPGEDAEDVEDFRKRYFNSFGIYSYGFNVQQYRETVNAMDGVSATKVFPAWNGGGTVKLCILDSTYRKPSTTLVDRVQEEIDPIANTGNGVGLAPIGHRVTVAAANEVPINVECEFEYLDTYTWENIKNDVFKTLDEYFAELARDWEEASVIVRINQITSKLMDVLGVQDVVSITINGDTKNISISEDSIPVRGTVNGET